MGYSSDIKKSISENPISINSCGELRIRSDSHVRRYAGRSDYQLIYICEGSCAVTINGSVQIAYPDDVILYRPGETQDYFLSQKVQPRTYWIHFNGDDCEKLFQTLSLEKAHIIKAGSNREIGHLVGRVCQYYNLKTPNYELLCSTLMQSILALLSNEMHRVLPQPGSKSADKISELISRMKMVQNLDFNVAKCADFCYMSKPHFSRVFKRTTGMSPVQFLLGIRIDRAKELLDFTDQSITDIAEACGFQDQNYFARTFKKITGLTPTQYRHADQAER